MRLFYFEVILFLQKIDVKEAEQVHVVNRGRLSLGPNSRGGGAGGRGETSTDKMSPLRGHLCH